MARWLAQLEGDRFDLEELPHWFPDGEVLVIEEKGVFFMVGPGFEALRSAEEVREKAIHSLHRMSAVTSLLCSSFRKPVLGTVFRESDDGRRSGFVFASATLTARAKVRAQLTVHASSQTEPTTQAQQLLAAAVAGEHIRTALDIWGDPTRSWPRLYRLLEEIEQHLGQHVDDAGLCSQKDRERFSRTANTAEVAGSDARHASGRFSPPADPMELSEASSFIGRLLMSAIRKGLQV